MDKEDVEEEFNLKVDQHSKILQDWLINFRKVDEREKEQIARLSSKLLHHVHDWNEEELKIYFIAFILDFVDFYQDKYRPFLERELSVEYEEGKRLWGIIDFVVAYGKQTPKKPYFFIHEYKKQMDTSNDPLGQLLIEMVTARELNQGKHPIYGAYIIGRHWYFVVLDGCNYSESLAYDATKKEIFDIVGILRHTKEIIDTLIDGKE